MHICSIQCSILNMGGSGRGRVRGSYKGMVIKEVEVDIEVN